MDPPNALEPLDPNITRPSSTRKTSEKLSPLATTSTDVDDMVTPVLDPSKTADEPLIQLSRPSPTSQPSFQRRKRIIWRNKACYIALPPENEHGLQTNRASYLKSEQIDRKLREWQERGFNTAGFTLASCAIGTPLTVSSGQSRAVHPDPEDESRDRSSGTYRVSIPDRQAWDNYVHHLKEEKLRNLGVTSSDDEPTSRKSPAPSLMSREASSQSSALLTSPPLQAATVPPNPFAPHYQLHSGQGSKPAIQHYPRYSVAMPLGDKATHSTAKFPSSFSPVHRNISPLAYLSSQQSSRIGSPSIDEHLSKQVNSTTPAAPSLMRAPSNQIMDHETKNLSARMKQGQRPLQAENMLNQQHSIAFSEPHGTFNYRGDAGARTNQDRTDGGIATPTPRAHSQNPSATLQREVDQAETQFQEAERRLSLPKTSTNGMNGTLSFNNHPTTHSLEDADLQVPKGGVKIADRELRQEQQHGSQSSVSSRLNVNAPEFKFEPKAPVKPDIVSFLTDQSGAKTLQSSFSQPSNLGVHGRKASKVRPNPKLNAAAPAFTPGAPIAPKPGLSSRVFSFGIDASSKAEAEKIPVAVSQEFSFSSNAPSFNPDAPAFQPGGPAHQESGPSKQEDPLTAKIFTNLDFSDVDKSAKPSKALPIFKPKNADEDDEADGPEDESGRITQSSARQKRMRRDQQDGDQVPQFAIPANDVDHPIMHPISPSLSTKSPSPTDVEKPTSNAEAATNLLGELVDDMSASVSSDSIKDDDATYGRGGIGDSHMLSDVEHDADSKVARSPRPSRDDRPARRLSDPSKFDRFSPRSPRKSRQNTSESLEHQKRRDSSSRASVSSPYNDSQARTNVARDGSHFRQDVLDGMRHVEPPFDELDDVMRYLNQNDDSDIGVERSPSPQRTSDSGLYHELSPRKALHESVARQLLPPANSRSDAPSPSPNRLREPFQYLPATDTESADSAVVKIIEQNAYYSPSYRPSRNSPHVQRLNSLGSSPPSDWNDGFSSVSENLLKARTSFFDHKVDDLVGDIVQRQLRPLEKALVQIQGSLVNLAGPKHDKSTSRRPRSSGTMEIDSSDADDEDEAEQLSQARLKSPLRERKYEQLKSTIGEIACAQQNFVSVTQFGELMNAVTNIQSSITHAPRAASPPGDLKNAIEEAVNRQMRGKSAPVLSSSQAAAAEKSQLQIAGLESMLKVAETRAEDELKARRATEDALADNQRLLRQALQETAQQRESVEATEAKLQEYHEERQYHLKHKAMLEGLHEGLERNTSDLEEKNKALEGTLAEYRLSHDQWRADTDSLRHENKDLQKRLVSTEEELHTSRKDLGNMRTHIANFQEGLAASSKELSADRLRWRNKDEEHRNQLDLLTARLEAEARTRERLEIEIERLEKQERESMKARFQAEQTLKANAHLHRSIEQTRSESHEHQNSAARLQRELNVTKETHIMEIHRLRSVTEADVKAANTEADRIRTELQGIITAQEKQLQSANMVAKDVKSEYESILDGSSKSHDNALQEAIQHRDRVLQEHIQIHEKASNDLRAQHQRALDNAAQDKQRLEIMLIDRLNLSDEKSLHLADNVSLLEEKLEIAKSAAQAAVQAAQAGKPAATAATAQAAISEISAAPEKVSPQALRESILVLQEQLQARESTIEELESKSADVDTDAPTKLKDAQVEIAWLRELLSVRTDDLQDIIKTLSQPVFNRETIRDAAIRLKANLQMEQQEKERAMTGSQSLPSLANITNLAASPRALPMAAATAWTNWRKTRESGYGNLSALARSAVNETPSKPSSSPRSVLSGLLTPPSTNFKSTPQLQARRSRPGSSKQRMVGQPLTPPQHATIVDEQEHESITPPLMRKGSYDLDAAEAAVFGRDHEAEETGQDYDRGDYEVAQEDEPFGPRIGTFTS